jgi:hypothetical protein
MLLVQPNLPRPFGLVKKLRAELVFEKKNGNKLGGLEAKWYKARKIPIGVWVPARLSEKPGRASRMRKMATTGI